MTLSRPDIQGHTYEELFQFGGREKDVRREHLRLLPYFKGVETVLDIGCGRGVCLQLLREAGIKPVGVDLFASAVEQCRALGFAEVFHSDALAFLRERPGAYDGIICSHVIEHLPFSDGKELIRLAFESLKPRGRLAIVTPNPLDIEISGQIFWLDPTHVRPYPLPLLNALLTAQGFRVLRQSQPLGVPNKRAIPRWLLLSLLLGRYFGRPTSIIIGERPPA
jgi:2-polyprenyl-3-methyl-5-hydroxy-6-metoxy-1,4-benzoquinol methylase